MAIGIRIRGLVQGVGFRPTVWRIAQQLELHGDVCNDGAGVWIRLSQATQQQAQQFCHQIQHELPKLAQIDSIQTKPIADDFICHDFSIRASKHSVPLTGIVPDAASCPKCQAEVNDPNNRRYGYPFTNCTHCGPRLSIIRAIPYDRTNTSMAAFPLCPTCEKEYQNPLDRRYHAQPNACPACGPHLWLHHQAQHPAPLAWVEQALRDGKIIALKGIGGFHLVCDASNADAVNQLRQRKKRYAKPFALMARDMAAIQPYCQISPQDTHLLQSPAAPIVLLNKKPDAANLPDAITMQHNTLGFMLPYSPLHHLLLKNWDTPLVMTSGNFSDEPQAIDNEEAITRLTGIADAILLHNRDIVNRVDDSVLRVMAAKPRFYRRARGYAPAPIKLHDSFHTDDAVLALGGELKNTFCLLQQGRATLSQHLGDLQETHTYDAFEHTVKLYCELFDFHPTSIAVDQHPEYRSTLYGQQLANKKQIPHIAIQHHHAHIAAVMAEHQLPIDHPPILGIALDGLGYAKDGTLWGGEFLQADFTRYQRLAHLENTPMLGSTQAIKEPWRNLYAQLKQHDLWQEIAGKYPDLAIIQYIQSKPLALLDHMLTNHTNSPQSSSTGRLFDAIAAALGVNHQSVFNEGQAAIALEHLALNSSSKQAYPLAVVKKPNTYQISSNPLWPALFQDLAAGMDQTTIAAKFHRGFANKIVELAQQLCKEQQINTVALSGGVWQNRYMLEYCIPALEKVGLNVLHHEQIPSNDGGLALGQAVIAMALG
jgi:hydrogenase maturation protein HypF